MSVAKLKSLEHLENSPMMRMPPPQDLEFTKNVYKKLPIIKSNLKHKPRGMSNDTSIIHLSNQVSTLSFDKGSPNHRIGHLSRNNNCNSHLAP